MTEDTPHRLDALFPEDPAISEAEVDRILDSTSHIGRASRLALAGGAAVLSLAAIEIIRRYKFSPGLPEEE